MDKTAIKNFAIWARTKLIDEIEYKAGLLGITAEGIREPLSQSTENMQFFEIGMNKPYSIQGEEILQRNELVKRIVEREKHLQKGISKQENDVYIHAYQYVVEEVAYTWFNRLIAIRFMEINDYMPSHLRVLSSEVPAKKEPDLVTSPFDADLQFTSQERELVFQLKEENRLGDLFRMLFIKQCNALNAVLPHLFEKTSDYTELLLNISFTDQDGVVYKLVHDIGEDNFNIEDNGQIEIIGWMYQYYNTEPKDETFALLKKNVKITKERIPAATQLFTPEWIVRYMVENSLGRLWAEGHPNEELKKSWRYYQEEAEQEPEVQVQLERIRAEYAELKPEDIKVIDPCMGSGHILVYAFDVLIQIYESYGYSARDAARSIAEHNLYGIDIDDRAFQLAYFAVMMKGRQFDRRFLTRGIEPNLISVSESNGMEPIPVTIGQIALDNSFRETVNYLISVFDDAKEYGSILNVEARDYAGMLSYFEELKGRGADDLLMEGWLNRMGAKLMLFAKQARMLSQKYDVVVTNPPYMGTKGMGAKLSEYVKKHYPSSKSDLFAVFIEHCREMVRQNGFQAMITQHAWMFLSSFEKFRKKFQNNMLLNMIHLGARAFDEINGEVVQTTSFFGRATHIKNYKGIYYRLIGASTQSEKEKVFLDGQNCFVARQDNFSIILDAPIAYWLSDRLFEIFKSSVRLSSIAKPRQGLATSDNNRFLKYWYEVVYCKIGFNIKNVDDNRQYAYKWFPCTKGGSFRRWYGNNEYIINWQNNGHEVKEYALSLYKHYTRTIKNIPFYFQKGLTWSTIASGLFSLRYVPEGFIFETKGAMCYVPDDLIKYILALYNSKIMQLFLQVVSPTLDYHEGPLGKTPVILKDDENINYLTEINIRLSKTDWDSFETSWDFLKHPLLPQKDRKSAVIPVFRMDADLRFMADEKKLPKKPPDSSAEYLSDCYMQWAKECQDRFNQLKANEEELNRIFIDIYGLQDELTPEVEDKDITVRKAAVQREIKSLISYAVGCMFGRYSLDEEGLLYAGGAWNTDRYKTFLPDKDNVIPITDEDYFEDDIVGLFCAWMKKVYGEETLEENLDFIAKALDNKGNTSREIICNYFLKDFFKDHCKIYQKRPIYWIFDSGKANGFKALIYMHRYNADSIGNLRIDYLHRMQRKYDSEIERMQETIDNSKDVRQVGKATKRKEKLLKQLKECKEYDERIAHLALARIEIDLDDGVKVNYEKVQTGSDGKKLQVMGKI